MPIKLPSAREIKIIRIINDRFPKIAFRDLDSDHYIMRSESMLGLSEGSDRGLWWKTLQELQRLKVVTINVVMADSTTMKVHRHGGGLKGGFKPREKTSAE